MKGVNQRWTKDVSVIFAIENKAGIKSGRKGESSRYVIGQHHKLIFI